MRRATFGDPRRFTRRERVRWIAPWAIVAAVGGSCDLAGVPVAWLIGPMLASVVLSIRGLPPTPNPSLVFTGVQAIIGTTLSASFTVDSLKPMAAHWLPVMISVVLVLAFSIAGGQLLSRIAPIDAATASLGTVPGGASGMVAMSEDLGGDARLVAFMQYLRLIVVVISISLSARLIDHDASVVQQVVDDGDAWPARASCLLAIAVSIAGGWLGLRLRIPAGALLGSMMVGLIPGGLDIGPVAWPPFVLPVAYLLLGARVGSRFDGDVLRRIRTLLPYIIGFVLGLCLLCAGIGWTLAATTDIDLLTALLATSPGGIDSATIAALATGANVPMVLSMQIVRLLIMVIAGPFLIRRLVPARVIATIPAEPPVRP
ncbi:MAG TPA: AbrB family transcriptional regulator [Thermomicrobiales bacterium]|nr:AbrB family transcriptional regulator [Thermomicrobiales bacterium]